MQSCLLCPRGKECRGYVLHTLILKLHDAMAGGEDADAIARQLSHEDLLVMAQYGETARATCWSKGFVLTIARKVADMVAEGETGIALRRGVERLIVQMDGLFAKLPKGVSIDLGDLAMAVFNEACTLLEDAGTEAVLPANIVGQACTAVNLRKTEAREKREMLG